MRLLSIMKWGAFLTRIFIKPNWLGVVVKSVYLFSGK